MSLMVCGSLTWLQHYSNLAEPVCERDRGLIKERLSVEGA